MKGITGAEENEDFYPLSASGEEISYRRSTKTGVCSFAAVLHVLGGSCIRLLK